MRSTRFAPVAFTPFDIQCYLRLALFLLAWKHASQDYSALAVLGDHPPVFFHHPGFVQTVAMFVNAKLLVSSSIVTCIQIVGVLACLVAIARPTRSSLILAFVSISLIEFPAFLWRYQNWDFDLCLVVILIAIACPIDLKKAVNREATIPTSESNILGWMIATYMVSMYFFAGLSKLLFDPDWIQHVMVGNNWRTQFLDMAEYGSISTILGSIASHTLLTVPILGMAVATVVLTDQLLMPLALFDCRFRAVGPLLVFCNHFGIALALGVFFSSMPFLGPGIFFPWSRVLKGSATPALIGQPSGRRS